MSSAYLSALLVTTSRMVGSVVRLVCSARKRNIIPIPALGHINGRGAIRLISHAVPVDLHYEVVEPPAKNASVGPLVICHGLFGSKQNWRSLSNTLASRLGRPVFALDLRNHGTSPHATPMTYSAMANDVIHFCQTHNLSKVSLLGHSMGGKVVMSAALSPDLPKDLLTHLIVADIAPAQGALSSDFRNYTHAMSQIEHSMLKSRKEADKLLFEIEPDTSIRAFLLTNLTLNKDTGCVKFRIPIDSIKDSLEELGDFPYDIQGGHQWDGRTLVIKGNKSRYLNKNNIPLVTGFMLKSNDARSYTMLLAKSYFRPHEFVELVNDFIKNSQ